MLHLARAFSTDDKKRLQSSQGAASSQVGHAICHTAPGSSCLGPPAPKSNIPRHCAAFRPTVQNRARQSTLLPFPSSCSCRTQAQSQASTTVAPAPTHPQLTPSSDSAPSPSLLPPSDEQLRASFRFLPRQLHVFKELQVAMRSCSQALVALAVGNVVANTVEVRCEVWLGVCGLGGIDGGDAAEVRRE